MLEELGFFRVKEGREFHIPREDMRRRILAEARRRRVTVKTTLQRDGFIRVDRVQRRRDYPWDSWLAGHQQELRPGVDFDCDLEVMREQARRAAKARGLGFRSKIFRDALWIQATVNKSDSPVG